MLLILNYVLECHLYIIIYDAIRIDFNPISFKYYDILKADNGSSNHNNFDKIYYFYSSYNKFIIIDLI